MIGLVTDTGNILMFVISPPNSLAEVCTFGYSFALGESGIDDAFPGPGEAVGVREVRIKYWMLVKVDSGISQVVSLDDNLMILTKSPPALQIVKWRENASSGNASKTGLSLSMLLSKIGWINAESDKTIKHISTSKAMGLMAITFESGNVYYATINESQIGVDESFFEGYALHKQSIALVTAINARFSTVAVGCENGSIYLYNIKDYLGSAVLIRVVEKPISSSGAVKLLEWASDGYSLFAGFDTGWAQFSVYGMMTASSFVSKASHIENEPWLGALQCSAWCQSDDSLYMVPNGSSEFWQMSILKWNVPSSFSDNVLQRPILYDERKMLIYRGHEQSDITTIDRDALLWLSVPFPANYIAEHWPIKYVSSSDDGRYVAVAGIRGLTHYSVYSGRWKMFSEDYMDHEFSVHGGIVWHDNLLIAAVSTDGNNEEVRVYSRNLNLSPHNILFCMEMSSPVLKLSVSSSLLLIYTLSNTLYFYNIVTGDNDFVSLELLNEVSFSGVVHSPARVRGFNCLPITDSLHPKSSEMAVLILADGMFVLLEPTNHSAAEEPAHEANEGSATPTVTYSKRILHHHLEYYTLIPVKGSNKRTLWGFDGQDLLVWLGDILSPASKPLSIPVDSYPLAILLSKGIAIGIETDIVLPREAIYTYFKSWTTTQLFVPYVLESYLKMGQQSKALEVATEYRKLKYFEHILEMLLYRILDYHVDQNLAAGEEPADHEPLLNRAVDLVSQFPQMLDVVLGGTRKTEVTYWPALFDIIGSPQLLFERCLAVKKLKTAGGYLLVLHNLEQYEQRSDNTKRLLKIAYESGEWDLCKELVRFLKAIDPSCEMLKQSLPWNE